jgi:HK97 family phage prohead protease
MLGAGFQKLLCSGEVQCNGLTLRCQRQLASARWIRFKQSPRHGRLERDVYSAMYVANRLYPLLWAHDLSQPLGAGHIEDSGPGLAVNGKLFLKDPAAQRALVHMKAGSVRGTSIGYLRPKGDKVEYRDDGARLLKEIHLVELSLVPVPAASRAQITAVKSLGDVRHMLNALREGDVSDDALSDLPEIDRELKRLLVGRDPAAENAELLRELQTLGAELKCLSD